MIKHIKITKAIPIRIKTVHKTVLLIQSSFNCVHVKQQFILLKGNLQQMTLQKISSHPIRLSLICILLNNNRSLRVRIKRLLLGDISGLGI